jgi:hypothetical protein
MNPNKITDTTVYKHCIIHPVPKQGGFDVFEDSGRWFHVKTQKQAKWWASVHSRLQDEFGSNNPKRLPHAIFDHTPRPKGELK